MALLLVGAGLVARISTILGVSSSSSDEEERTAVVPV